VKLLIDMNLSPRWAGYLSNAGFEAVHWSSLGPRDSSDIAIMAHARAHDYVVLTHDLDFGAILAATHGDKPSVVPLRADDVSPETIGAPVAAALKAMDEELAAGALITVDLGRTRMTVLPLRIKPGA
jgi:predicted nuclease of predicted toxin-antitoxin system